MNVRQLNRLKVLISEGITYRDATRKYLNTGAASNVSLDEFRAWYVESRDFLASHGVDSPDYLESFALRLDWEGRVDGPMRRTLNSLTTLLDSELGEPHAQLTAFATSRPPPEISKSLERFTAECPDPTKSAFIMMRFAKTKPHEATVAAIRETLAPYGFRALRADDKQYHDDLLYNILTYVYGCGFGIAVFERIEQDDFNPNVSFEVGWMCGLGKQVCLLKDRTLKTLHTDLIGRLYRTFDPHDPIGTIRPELSRWLLDMQFIKTSTG